MGDVRARADRYLHDVAELDPVRATSVGLPGHDDRLTDYSPVGFAARADLSRRTLAEVSVLGDDADEPDRRCAALLRDRLTTERALHDAGEHLRPLRIIGSPVGAIRSVFDLMPRASADHWDVIATRLEAVPEAVGSVTASLEKGRSDGLLAARRQALACADQAATWAGNGSPSWFSSYVGQAAGVAGDALIARLDAAASGAADAYATLCRYLRTTYAPEASDVDGVGADRYRLSAGQFLGAILDVDEAYAWGWDELHRIEDEIRVVGEEILPGSAGDLDAVIEHLDTNGHAVEGEDNLRRWLQELMDSTIAELDGTHFDLAPRVRLVEAMIAPPGTAAAQYYTAPSADFSRPGRTWFPTLGATRFPTWGEVSTCYHEGVPGHHLQLAQWKHVADDLSLYQGSTGISANLEGWALYAERLMDELGYLTNPADRFGYLGGQLLRAARVVVDIGVHTGQVIPAGERFYPGETWTPALAGDFLETRTAERGEFIRSELVRYLGWPGQAISYKLGERVWLAGRDAARKAKGDSFDLKAWHMAALSQGSLGLDDLATELARL